MAVQHWRQNHCTHKIIQANTTVNLVKEGDQDIDTELKLDNIPFAKLNSKLSYFMTNWSITKTEIEKTIYVEPDE